METTKMRDAKFDRMLGSLHGLPDVISTNATTVRAMTPLVGSAETWFVQTYRQAGRGDVVFVEYVDGDGSLRLVLPAEVTETIARQRDALTSRVRSTVAKTTAAGRKARGEDLGAHLRDPEVRRKAARARQAKAAARAARRARA